MGESDNLSPNLWTPRPVEETMEVYAGWAETYEAEVTARGYRTPDRIAAALTQHAAAQTPILDFGCGTGIGGAALRKAGFTTIDGTDIVAEMLEKATESGIYRKTWVSAPGVFDFNTGAYPVITAAGVVSLGAAPAETLAPLVDRLAPDGLLALSYNDPTLADESYVAALDSVCSSGAATIVFREHGVHLADVGMGSDVIILRRE